MFNKFSSFQPAWRADSHNVDAADTILFICKSGGMILVKEANRKIVFSPSMLPDLPEEWPVYLIGTVNNSRIYLCAAPPDAPVPGGYIWNSPRDVLTVLDPGLVDALIRASMIAAWEWDHRYCGRCGTATFPDTKEIARVCPVCHYRAYPRVSPAIITLIEAAPELGFDEPRILLANNRSFSRGLYSCVAGFVDAGECLERAVIREVREEVGLDVMEPRYVSSQAWPGPHSLMTAFITTASGDPVPDGQEILDARWFSAGSLPDIPPVGTISRFLIDHWLSKTRGESGEGLVESMDDVREKKRGERKSVQKGEFRGEEKDE